MTLETRTIRFTARFRHVMRLNLGHFADRGFPVWVLDLFLVSGFLAS